MSQQTLPMSPPEWCIIDRSESDLRKQQVPFAVERRCLTDRRASGPRRHGIDPTTSERDYSGDEVQFMKAMDLYKRDNRRPFPTWSEVLEVIHALGYRRVAKPKQMPGLSTCMPPKVKG